LAKLSDRSMEFLFRDKAEKVDFLNAHFGRMWTRFNFFVSIETGLLGFMLLSGGNSWSDKALYFVLAGVFLSFLWWFFGAQDRALVQYYRCSVEQATCRITANLPKKDKEALNYDCHCHYVGNQYEWTPPKPFNPVELYFKRTSITRLAAYTALFTTLFWLGLALLVPIPSELICSGVTCVDEDGLLVPATCWQEDNGKTECQVNPGTEVSWEKTLKKIRFVLVILFAAIVLGLIILALIRSEPDSNKCE